MMHFEMVSRESHAGQRHASSSAINVTRRRRGTTCGASADISTTDGRVPLKSIVPCVLTINGGSTLLHEGRQYIVFTSGAESETALTALTLPAKMCGGGDALRRRGGAHDVARHYAAISADNDHRESNELCAGNTMVVGHEANENHQPHHQVVGRCASLRACGDSACAGGSDKPSG